MFPKVIWITITVAMVSCAGMVLREAVFEIIEYPTGAETFLGNVRKYVNPPYSDVGIETFSSPATLLDYPAITLCKKYKYDTGEYVRAVYDNYLFRQFSYLVW